MAGLDAAARAVGAHAVSRAPVERELRAYCAVLLWGYLDWWWGPGAVLLLSAAILGMVGGFSTTPDSLADQVAGGVFDGELCGFLVAALSNFIRRRWRTGLAQLASLPGCLVAITIAALVLCAATRSRS